MNINSKPTCCTESLSSHVICLQLPKRKHVRVELFANGTCLRSSIRVLDIDGAIWEHSRRSVVQQVILTSKQQCFQLQTIWKKMVMQRFEETLERVTGYNYFNMQEFHDQCHEAELYINHMAMLDLERWNDGLMLLEPA
jgi:hypothetical protein